MSAILEFRDVSFAHGSRKIFDGLSLSVEEGETVALMGANGVGKTTLLRLAAALLHPASGEILVDGKDLHDWGRRELSRTVALVPQHLEVPFAFPVEEIVAQGRVPHRGFFGRLSRNDLDAVESAMEAVDIIEMRNCIFAELSGGEQQRVKIAIGLAQQPKLMLLDEPTQHLDLGRQIELMALLRKLVKRGITIVAAMHDLALVREHCSTGILLTPGAPVMEGPVTELFAPERLERAFSVERSDLDRYLTGGPCAPGSEDSPVMNQPLDHRERLRGPGDEHTIRRWRNARSRRWRHWDHD